MNRFARSAAILVAVTALAAAPARAAASPSDAIAPLADAEITRYVALQNDLLGDAGRAQQFCAMQAESAGDGNAEKTPAAIGRKLEANPMFAGLMRRQGFSGQRYAEVSLQIFAGALGLGMADDFDKTARAQGKPATNRAELLQKSAEARAVAPRLAELSAVFDKVGKLCSAGEEEEEEAQPEDDDNP
jgi:hypothetical protein